MKKEKIELTNGGRYEFDDIDCPSSNLLSVTFDSSVGISALTADMSIFETITLLTRGGGKCGTFSGYTTVYKIEDNTLTLSNDGTVYVEPMEKSESEKIDIPTKEPALEEVVASKIKSLSETCERLIINGVDVMIGVTTQHFSYSLGDQNNIDQAFTLAVQTGLSVPYHCDDGNCTLYSVEDITKIYVAEKSNLTHHQTYFNQLKQYVKSLNDIELVNNVNYGDKLTGEYLDTYNTIMEQANLLIQKITGGEE